MENQKPVANQGLLDALESLGAALSVVSISVDMVREELQSVLSVLAGEPESGLSQAREADEPECKSQPSLFSFSDEVRVGEELLPEERNAPPAIYLVDGRVAVAREDETEIYGETDDAAPVRLTAALHASR